MYVTPSIRFFASKSIRCLTHMTIFMVFSVTCASAVNSKLLHLTAEDLSVLLDAAPLRFTFFYGGQRVFSEITDGTVYIDGQQAVLVDVISSNANSMSLRIATPSGKTANLEVAVSPHHVSLRVKTPTSGDDIEFHTGGASPAYGLGDHAVLWQPFSTDVTGFRDDHFLSGEGQQGTMRLESNFILYPRQHVAMVLPEPTEKIIRSSAEETVQGVRASRDEVAMHYFFGSTHEIYAEYRKVREEAGYPILRPKYELFGVGWEAFGALGWNTNQETVADSVDHYLKLGYPIRWVVIGSGFWPAAPAFRETTSFGFFNRNRYPQPEKLIAHFHGEGLKVLFGLRICFITNGPFAAEGVKRSFFIKNSRGEAAVFRGSWPESAYYLLDSHKSDALAWYDSLVKYWTDVGVDGFKEDYYDFGGYHLPDDKVDPVNTMLMHRGLFVIERNGYLSSDGDLHRINDFNYDQHQDRGPVNALALAYSGFPLVYPDIVGGTFGEEHFDTRVTPRIERYMMRNAQWASLHPSMAMGQPPWSFPSKETGEVMLKAAQIHGRLQPYFYSQAVRFSEDGYPWPMTPLPVAFPEDLAVYDRENEKVRGYEWMIGPSLLATPLYGDDYETAESRDVYLPAGSWMDYETGERFEGPRLLKNWRIPVEKTPLFVGGDGVILEEDAGNCVARIYPLKKSSETTFFMPKNSGSVVVKVNVEGWNKARVIDLNNQEQVAARWIRYGLQWGVLPGHQYEVR